MWRHAGFVALIWIILTAALEILALNINIFPVAASEEAILIDESFQLLLLMAIPVFTFVIVFLGYSLLVFRGTGEIKHNPARQGLNRVAVAWLIVTSVLAVFVIFNPGFVGMNKLESNNTYDLEMKVEAVQWHWNFSFPEYGVTLNNAREIRLPVGRRVRVELTSQDVIHSFWVPAFRLKQDAVPGRVATLYFTPNRTGSYNEDFNYRVQCAELCGTGHDGMRTPLAVVQPDEFEEWIAGLR